MKLPLVFSALLALAGCGGTDSEAAPGAGGSGGAGTGGSAGAGGAAGASGSGGSAGASVCPAGSHAEGAVCTSALTGWTDAPALAAARDHHVTFAVETAQGRFLFAAGGVKDMASVVTSTERASIAADGSVGPWSSAQKLPEAVIGAGLAQVDRVVVVTAGLRLVSGKTATSTRTNVATVAEDGSISAWESGPELGVPRFHGASASLGKWVYTAGGLTGDGTDNTPSVEVASLEGGKLSAWTETTALPEKRSHHAFVGHGQKLYVIGGLSGDPAGANTTFDDVLAADVGSDGSVGAWSKVGQLPEQLATHSAVVHADGLYVLGGVSGEGFSSANTAKVYRASFAADGSLGTFAEHAPLPKARAHAHHTPVVAGFVYSVAGAFEHASMTDVFVGKLE